MLYPSNMYFSAIANLSSNVFPHSPLAFASSFNCLIASSPFKLYFLSIFSSDLKKSPSSPNTALKHIITSPRIFSSEIPNLHEP